MSVGFVRGRGRISVMRMREIGKYTLAASRSGEEMATIPEDLQNLCDFPQYDATFQDHPQFRRSLEAWADKTKNVRLSFVSGRQHFTRAKFPRALVTVLHRCSWAMGCLHWLTRSTSSTRLAWSTTRRPAPSSPVSSVWLASVATTPPTPSALISSR